MKNILFNLTEPFLLERDTQAWDKFCEANKSKILFLIFQHEIGGKNLGHHIQAYCELSSSLRTKQIQKLFGGRAFHIDPRKGTQEDNITYCTKAKTAIAGSQYRWGTPVISKQGQRKDIELYYEGCKNLKLTMLQVADEYPKEFMKYHKAGEKRRAMQISKEHDTEFAREVAKITLKTWQLELKLQLEQPPDKRTIIWFVDKPGQQGKTDFAKWAVVNMDAQVIQNGKSTDIAHAYQYKNIVILDLAKCKEGRVNYGIMENIKNGMMFSPKYDSHTKYFKPPHLVVMANWWPEYDKMSMDRWMIYEIHNGERYLVDQENYPSIIRNDD